MTMKWVRAKDGAIFGVCKGLARTLDIPVGIFRLIWVASILCLGVGFGLYLILAIALPREDKQAEAMEPWILGVCAKLARREGWGPGLVRFLTICLGLLSGGVVLLGYIILYFVLEDKTPQSSDKSPSIPPSTT
jgi:phage shock protein PspC (stress-responsive transcriptional regulator)